MFKVEHKVALGMRTNPIHAAVAFLQVNNYPFDKASFDAAAMQYPNTGAEYHVQDFVGLFALCELCAFDIVIKRGLYCCVMPCFLQPIVNLVESEE